MQDAADSAAFSAAVLHARGMNLLALINMIMAALLAILVALKLVESVLGAAIAIIALAGLFGAPGLLAAVPGLSQLRSQVLHTHDAIRPVVLEMLDTLHAAGSAVRVVVPAASVARGSAIASGYPGSPAEVAVVLPPRLTLPTKDGRFGELCERAGGYVGDLAGFAVSGTGPAADLVDSLVTELAGAGAGWFCGEGSAPASSFTLKLQHPVLPSVAACEAYGTEQPDYDAQRHHALCAQADRDKAAARPDRVDGRCGPGCERAAYELRARLARSACAPRPGQDALRAFVWQERRFSRTYVWHRGRWGVHSDAASEERTARYRLRRSDLRPCGHARAVVGPEWQREPQAAGNPRPAPLCSDVRAPEAFGYEGQTRSLEHVEVVHLFGCSERVRRDVAPAPGDRVAKDAQRDGTRVPQLLLDGAELGDDHFQLRAVVLGKEPPHAAARGVKLAAWGRRRSTGSAALAAAAATSWPDRLRAGRVLLRARAQRTVRARQRALEHALAGAAAALPAACARGGRRGAAAERPSDPQLRPGGVAVAPRPRRIAMRFAASFPRSERALTRRRRRGAALLEAVIVVPVLGMLLVAVPVVFERYARTQQASLEARRCAWGYARSGCTQVPEGCGLPATAEAPPAEGDRDVVARARGVQGRGAAVFDDVPELERALAAILGETAQAGVALELRARGGVAQLPVHGHFAVACNERPREVLELAQQVFCGHLPLLDCGGEP